MSLLSSGGFFGRRRNDPPPHQPTWDHYQAQDHHHPLGVSQPHHPPPFMSFPSDSSPVLNTALIEWKETPEAHVYKAHLPSYKRNDVRLEVDEDRVLCIVCDKSVEKEEQREGWHRVELSNGQFVQRLTLPENSMVDLVKAYMDNGVLTINVPKKHHRGVNNRVRNINISSRP